MSTNNIYADSKATTEAGEMFPQYIYATPDAWGSVTVYAADAAMQATIANLIDAGGEDWNGINIDDCSEWTFEELIERDGKTMAIYACHEGRHPQFARFQQDGGTYKAIEFYSNVDDARSDE